MKPAVEGPEREWWIKSITSEFNNFLSRGAWKFLPRQMVYDSNRKLIPTKLVFKKKDEIDGLIHFKTQDVILGFMMVQGVDFTERFSPVATDASSCIQVAITLKFHHLGWVTRSCDVEATFLESDMDVDMYIEPHPAMVTCGIMSEKEQQKTTIKLLEFMYGNVDAAIKLFKTISPHLTNENGRNMMQSKVESCVFFKLNNDKLILFVLITVDGCAITGTNEDVDWFMDQLEKNSSRSLVIQKHTELQASLTKSWINRLENRQTSMNIVL